MDSDEVDDQAATVAGDSDATTSVPPQTEAGPELACTQDDDTDEPTRHPRHAAWATAGVLVLGAVILVAVAGIVSGNCGRNRAAAPTGRRAAANGNIRSDRAADRRHTDTSCRHLATPAAELPSPSTMPQTPSTPTEFTAADDQRLFANLQQYGYPIADPENVARVAHTYCHALQRGESSEQADAEAAPLLANPADETAITAAASLALPHCNG